MFASNAGLVTLCDHSPRRHGVTATRSFACATTHRMIDGVFRNCTAERTNATVPPASGFAENYILVLRVPDLANGRIAVFVDSADFARRQADLGIAFIARHESRRAPCGTNHLRATAGENLDIVNRQTDGNIPERKTVAGFGRGSRSADDFCANGQAIGSNDVALFAIFIFQQCQTRGPARIVFDRCHFGFHAMFVALEVDEPNLLLVAAANAATGDATVAVAPAGFLANLNEVLFRLCFGNLVIRRDGDVARRWRERSKTFYWHNKFLGQNDLVAFFEGDDRFLPVWSFAGLGGALAARFAAYVHGIDADDLDFEQLLDGLANLGLGRAAVSHDSVLVELLALASAFLGQAGSLDDFK